MDPLAGPTRLEHVASFRSAHFEASGAARTFCEERHFELSVVQVDVAIDHIIVDVETLVGLLLLVDLGEHQSVGVILIEGVTLVLQQLNLFS